MIRRALYLAAALLLAYALGYLHGCWRTQAEIDPQLSDRYQAMRERVIEEMDRADSLAVELENLRTRRRR